MNTAQKWKKRQWLIGGMMAVLILAGCAAGLHHLLGRGNDQMGDILLTIENTDKARYTPGEGVCIDVTAANQTGRQRKDITLHMRVYHLDKLMDTEQQELTLDAMENRQLVLDWQAPEADYTGYLVSVSLEDKRGNEIARDTIGVDVSSSWVKYPRYGYLCDYGEAEDVEGKLTWMNRFHINAIEYYDWHALHHEPLPAGVTSEDPGVWEDWAGHQIYGSTMQTYLRSAHEKNMVNMAYNMIYAGTDSFVQDSEGQPTEANKWQIYFAPDNTGGEGAFTFRMGLSPSGNGNLYFMNPLNEDWQEYIFAQHNRVFDILDFDGWHGDTVGDWGKMTDANGEPLGYDEQGEPVYLVKDTYRSFLNAAKEALGDHYLSFNPVGAQGIEQVNTSKSDVLYTEFWPWDQDREGVLYDTYPALVTEIERTMEESKPYSLDGKGKSLTVKAYINYYKTNGTMNDAAVLLCDAAVYAAGGSRLELGNGDRMLHVEYYPDDDILMGEALRESMIQMADFTVAYENLLRDGQYTTDYQVEIADYPVSSDGAGETIWTYTRADGEYDILHLINLLGTDNEWRDERGKKEAPDAAENLKIKYYTDRSISQIQWASFSVNDGLSQEISFRTGRDEAGAYVEFVIPELMYWDMIYMK